jgi:hypothetical protein
MAAKADLGNARRGEEEAREAIANLEVALNNVQAERDQEVGMVERMGRDALEGERRAFEAKIAALDELNRGKVAGAEERGREALEKGAAELAAERGRGEKIRAENVALRRSLDGAIERLQVRPGGVEMSSRCAGRGHAQPSTCAAEHMCGRAGRRGGSGGLPPTTPSWPAFAAEAQDLRLP